MTLHYTIRLDPRTKKNSLQIAGCGPRCPVCKKHQRQFVRQGKTHDRYQSDALIFLRPKPSAPIETPVSVRCHFYMQTRRKVDAGNLLAAVDDLLVDAGILKDDNTRILVHHDGTRVFYDKRYPRTEIWIEPYEEENDVQRENVPG